MPHPQEPSDDAKRMFGVVYKFGGRSPMREWRPTPRPAVPPPWRGAAARRRRCAAVAADRAVPQACQQASARPGPEQGRARPGRPPARRGLPASPPRRSASRGWTGKKKKKENQSRLLCLNPHHGRRRGAEQQNTRSKIRLPKRDGRDRKGGKGFL